MPRRGTGRRSGSMQVHPSESFRELGPEPPSPTFSASTAFAEVNYAGSEDTLSERRVPGAFPAGDRIDSGEWRRLSPNDDQAPISETYSSLPRSEADHSKPPKYVEDSRHLLLPSEIDSDQWVGVSRPETNGDVRFPTFIQDPAVAEQWRLHSDTAMWNNSGSHTEVDPEEWRRVKVSENNARMPPQALQPHMPGPSQWEPPAEPISRLVKRTKEPETRQHGSSNPVPIRPESYVRPQHLQAEVLPGPGSAQQRQAVGSGRLLEPSDTGTNSNQQRLPLANDRHAPGAPPGAPTGPRRGVSGPNRHPDQVGVTRRDERRVAFDLGPNNRAPRGAPAQPMAQTREARRRTASGGNGGSRQVSAVANGPPPQTQPSASRGARHAQTNANRTSQPNVPIVNKTVHRTSPAAKNKTAQQQQPVALPPNPQQESAAEPPKRTRTRTRSKRKKNTVWAAVCSKRRYVIAISVSFLLLVALLVGLIKFVKP